MDIMYIHGFGSSYDPESDKVKSLAKLGKVYGASYDYTKPANENIEFLIDRAISSECDIIVGTSLGAWYAIEIGARLGIPAVMINPAIDPHNKLKKYSGHGVDWNGNEFVLFDYVIMSYHDMTRVGYGLILLDDGDDVTPASEVFAKDYDMYYNVLVHEGGSHRFEHMEESLDIIKAFYNRAEASYGN